MGVSALASDVKARNIVSLTSQLKKHIPLAVRRFLAKLARPRLTRSRKESNIWLRHHAADIGGRVLSIGSGRDVDIEGDKYQDYFKSCSTYITSDITPEFGSDMVLDVRSMPEIPDESFDCIFCSGVLEHVDDYLSALREMTRILKSGGVLLLGLPFQQPLHMVPHDYRRFTEYGIRYMLQGDYEILDLSPMDSSVPNFPAAYWVKARKRREKGN